MRKKIFVRAPCLSQSGYGEQSRFAIRALKSREDLFDIYLQPIPWGQTGWIWEDDEFRQWMDSRIVETQIQLQQRILEPDISLQITVPNEFEKLCPVNIGYTAGIETDRVAPEWLQKGNVMDKILVVSNHSKSTYENTVVDTKNPQTGEDFSYKLETPIEVVGETTPRHEAEVIEGLNLATDFNFLVCSQISPRKNFANTISWWIKEFQNEEVGLIIKTNMKGNSKIDLNATEENLKAVLKEYPDRKCKVYLLHGDLTSGQMTTLYTHPKIKALINIAHGEGFGLPMFEAAREGLPVVTVAWSGQLDFLHHQGRNYFQKVDYTISKIQKNAVWNGVLQEDSNWAYADESSYRKTLRNTYENWDETKETANELQKIVTEKFDAENLYSNFVSKISNIWDYNETEEIGVEFE